MKKSRLCYLILFIALLASCNKPTLNSYQPNTPGSYWKYKVEVTGNPSGELTETVAAGTTSFEGKVYHKVKGRSKSDDSLRVSYYAQSGPRYYTRTSLAKKSAYDLKIDLLYLDESKPAGIKWNFLNDSSALFKTSGTCAIVAKGISKTINGKVFNDIIHSRTVITIDMKMGQELGMPKDLNLNLGGLTQTFIVDFYVAKGIGVVESDMTSAALPSAVVKQTLLNYEIK